MLSPQGIGLRGDAGYVVRPNVLVYGTGQVTKAPGGLDYYVGGGLRIRF